MRTQKPKPSKDTTIIVDEQNNGVELLAFLLDRIKNKSRNNIKSLLGFRAVSVDGKVVTRFNERLKTGQTVSVSAAPKNDNQYKNTFELPFPILHEDDSIIAIDKPCGLLSIATDKEKEVTAYRFLTEYVKQKNPNNRIYIVHRLDRDTSGILVFAKNEDTKHILQDNWEKIAVTRGYIAVLEGTPKPTSGTVHSWLKETQTHVMYSSGVKGNGQEAITDYRVIRSSNGFSLVELRLKTGRKNQIRVHMSDIGTPVTGDKKYGALKSPIKRLALHANLLEIKHPISGEIMRFASNAPRSFYRCTSSKQ